MNSRIGATTPRQILWSESVLELRQGDRWIVVPPGRVIWAPRRLAVWASHGGARIRSLTMSHQTADRLPRHAAGYWGSDVLMALLPLVSRHVSDHSRRRLDEQVIIDELHASTRQEHGLFIEGFVPGLGWGTTLGIATAGGHIGTRQAAMLTLDAARAAASTVDWLVRLRLALILKAHRHGEDVIRDALTLFAARPLERILADEFDYVSAEKASAPARATSSS